MLRGLVFRGNMISFQIEIGAPSGDLGMGLTGRSMCAIFRLQTSCCASCAAAVPPVAAATFAELMLKSMQKAPAGKGT